IMKPIYSLLLLLTLMLAGSSVNAQGPIDARTRIITISRLLSVGAAQAEQVVQLQDQITGRIRKISRDTSIGAAEKQQRIVKIQAERKQKLEALLNKEQIAKLEAGSRKTVQVHREQK